MVYTADRNRQGGTPDLAPKCLKLWEIFPLISDELEAKSPAGRIRDSTVVGNLFAVASLHHQIQCRIQRDIDDCFISPLSSFTNCLYLATSGLETCGFQHC